jgi:ubiquinone/menaquinone biosynthesis C-methylase UbiE
MASRRAIAGTPGEIYEQHMVPAIFARWAPDIVEAAGIRAGQSVLDLACGAGAVTRLVATRVGPEGRVVGLDINPGMLAVARVAASAPNVEWREGSALKMPLPDATFDAAVCQQGLQFFPDRSAALSEVRRVLKPGGRLALSCWRSIEHTPVSWHSSRRSLAASGRRRPPCPRSSSATRKRSAPC